MIMKRVGRSVRCGRCGQPASCNAHHRPSTSQAGCPRAVGKPRQRLDSQPPTRLVHRPVPSTSRLVRGRTNASQKKKPRGVSFLLTGSGSRRCRRRGPSKEPGAVPGDEYLSRKTDRSRRPMSKLLSSRSAQSHRGLSRGCNTNQPSGWPCARAAYRPLRARAGAA